VINEVYGVIVKKTKNKQTKKPNTQENGKSQEAKIGLQKPDFVVYLNSGSNLLGRLRRNQSLSILMGTFSAPVCTSSPKMGIVKED
jgi:trafficking kinesin-binding protein 2